MLKKVFLIASVILISCNLMFCQTGGTGVYDFLNLTNSARIAGVGGQMISVNDNDNNILLQNPSLYNKGHDNRVSLNYLNMPSGINTGNFVYSKYFPVIGDMFSGVQYVNYGEFILTDETGLEKGSFYASDYALNIGCARQLDSNFSIGLNFKGIFSNLDNEKSVGIAFDGGTTYHNRKYNFDIAFVLRNYGKQIKSYNDEKEDLPYEVMLGFSKKLQHMPFKLIVTLTNLQKYDLTYETEEDKIKNTDPITNQPLPENKFIKTADKLLRHVIVGGELFPNNGFNIYIGYNYRQKQEMKVESNTLFTGLSVGFGVKILKFKFSFAYNASHIAGGMKFFSLSTNINSYK